MLFRRGYNFEFPWVLIFVGAVFGVYLKSRCLFKVIMETTNYMYFFGNHLQLSEFSVFIHHEIQLLGQFLFCTVTRAGMQIATYLIYLSRAATKP